MLTASGSTTSGTDQTAFLIDQSFIAAIRTFLPFGFRSVLDIFLQCVLHRFPSIDTFTVQLQRTYQFDHLFNRHPVTGTPEISLRIVPVFFVELL